MSALYSFFHSSHHQRKISLEKNLLILYYTGMKKVDVQQKQWVYDDFFKVEEAFLRFEKFNGQMSETVRRLNFDRGDAVAVLLFNRQRQKLVLVNQFRYPTYESGGGWTTEVVAGILEKGEQPEDTVRREVEEEVGYQVLELEAISTFYLSPGTEFHFCKTGGIGIVNHIKT